MESEAILRVEGLRTEFNTGDGPPTVAVRDLSFHVNRGETLCIVGESGCGKSLTALSVLRLLPRPYGRIGAGRILLDGQNLVDLAEAEIRAVRGRAISMIFQEPMTSLNPVLNIGRQIAETVMVHEGLTWQACLDRALEMLRQVRIPEPERRLHEYPHQLSGGMRQRV
ncbi:MAG: ABC transporter ATP-binding protein, partial [Acetobacteraceae bacterium]|nr:ABC transporter ATP-binding protein [Acetobacteraceae bacterium]NBS43074.1 ABC transporter ATP-binding protein [Acetobacteraceae bacterium]